MKKIVALFYFSFLFSGWVYAQETEDAQPGIIRQVGINTRFPDLIPYEAYYRRYDPSDIFGFQLKGTYGSYFQASNMQMNNVRQGAMTYSYVTKAMVVKPGIILFKRINNQEHVTTFSFIAVSGNIAYTLNNLVFDFNDPVYGRVKREYDRSALYRGVELEFTNSILWRTFFINGSVVTGAKESQINIFNDIVPGLNNATTYTPGQGYGKLLYIQFLLGVGIRL
jgi:hypothetical protein